MSKGYEAYEKAIKEKGLTSYRVSKDTGIAPTSFYAWANGEYTPKIDKLMKIAEYLGIDVAQLLEIK